LFKQSKNLPLD